jgi:hypothetical protein
MPVRYRAFGKRRSVAGVGRIMNISSAGLLITAAEEIPLGTRLEIMMEWPSLLDGNTPLQLVALCKVVRCDHLTVAVELERYQFRTMKRKQESIGNSDLETTRAASA